MVGLPSSSALPFLTRRCQDQRILAATASTIVSLGFALLTAASQWAVVSGVLTGLGGGALLALAPAFQGRRAADASQAAALASMAQSVGHLVAAIGPLLLGALHDLTGGRTLPLLLLVALTPIQTDGLVVTEESTVTGVPAERTTLEPAGNRVTAIGGGTAAAELRRYAPDDYCIRHALIGLNPKVRSAGGTPFEREKHAGAFHFGLDGLTAQGTVDRSGPGHAHCDCQFDAPTVTLDGERFVDNGRLLLLDDPHIRELAQKSGPAQILLNPNPRRVLPPPLQPLTRLRAARGLRNPHAAVTFAP
ncbi:hypothetical protein [Streptomyces broussonetiae]|uniref:hypothetical protein n=1 Tax=Streptomyces broussonetiae TaxID=2686304 RepID=UPI0018EED1F0|nr:hypothetical protein [Streptomyces broussonetiae]